MDIVIVCMCISRNVTGGLKILIFSGRYGISVYSQ